MSSSSSLSSSGSGVDFTKEALLEKKEKRLAIAGFGMTCAVESRWSRLLGCMSDGPAKVSRGSPFSFVGDGRIPMLIGSDSPLNQSVSFPTFCSDLPVRMENLLDRVGDDCRDCCGE